MKYTCADCGVGLLTVQYTRRITADQRRSQDAGLLVERDPLCEPCWKKQNHA